MARLTTSATLIAAACLLSGSLALAQSVTDPGDLAFWQSIQNSTNPAEYGAYLQAYPNGRFATLARLRMNAGPPPAIAPAPEREPASDYTIGVSPAAVRVGQPVKVSCGNIPTGGQFDQLVIVPAGTPEMQPNRGREDTHILWNTYIYACANGTIQTGPFAPGAYELRWMSTLFNNDQPARYEMKAKAQFTVR